MLGQALSFALVKQGLEPLHATVVVLDDQAVAFLGDHAFGKSSLAACFLEWVPPVDRRSAHPAGVVRRNPGVSRPPAHQAVFPDCQPIAWRHDNRVPMNGDTDKLILPIDEHRRCARPVPLKAIYSLAAPRDGCRTPRVSIEMLTPRRSLRRVDQGHVQPSAREPAAVGASIRRHVQSDEPRLDEETGLSKNDRLAAGSPAGGERRSRSRSSHRLR